MRPQINNEGGKFLCAPGIMVNPMLAPEHDAKRYLNIVHAIFPGRFIKQ